MYQYALWRVYGQGRRIRDAVVSPYELHMEITQGDGGAETHHLTDGGIQHAVLFQLMLYDADGATSVLRISDEKVPDDAVYDFFGRRVSHPLPGTLYIRNGSKFILRP